VKKKKPKSDFLDGNRHRIQSDAVREAVSVFGFNWSEQEYEEVADKTRLQAMEQAACRPEDVLEHGKLCLRYMKKVIDPHRRLLDPNLRKKLRAHFVEKRGLSAKEADREIDAVGVRAGLTLRCMRDAGDWLHKAYSALTAGQQFIANGKAAMSKRARMYACSRAEYEFARAISLAFYAGVECSELKARASWDEKFGSDERPKREGRFSKLREATFREYRRFAADGQKPTNADLRDAVAQPEKNGITYKDGYFWWSANHGRQKKTSDRSWENIVTAVRKSLTV
jgi:hypothetical protein